MTNEPNKLAE